MRTLSLVLLLSSVSPVFAQAPDANTKAILDALQGINSRLDTIEQRIDKVEGQVQPSSAPSSQSAPNTATPPAATTSSSAPPGMVVQPGWLIGVLPFAGTNPEPDPILYFPYPKSSFTLNEHMKHTSSQNWVRYKGEAKFNAYQTGRYQFVAEITATDQMSRTQGVSCWGYFKINGDDVFLIGAKDKAISIPSPRTQSFTGAVDLSEGNYDVVYRISCVPNDWGNTQSPRDYFTGNQDEMWRRTQIQLSVRTPSDLAPRAFTAKELFFFAPASATTAVNLPSVGEQRSLQADLNVRRTASTNAPIAAQLASGEQIEVLSLSADQEWAEVANNGRRLGFVKISALNANSQ